MAGNAATVLTTTPGQKWEWMSRQEFTDWCAAPERDLLNARMLCPNGPLEFPDAGALWDAMKTVASGPDPTAPDPKKVRVAGGVQQILIRTA